MNINYLKLAATPAFSDVSPVVSALRSGDYFVTSGVVLIHDLQLKLSPSGQVTGEADLAWTFPLQMYELVWGDGQQTQRRIVPLTGTGQFGRRKFAIQQPCPGAKWVRFAVWDVAANGAFSQPVRLEIR